jgi:hypothetical protein
MAAGLLTVLLCGCSDKSPPAPAGKGPGPVPPKQGVGPAAQPAPGSGAATAQPAPGVGSATVKPAPAAGSATVKPAPAAGSATTPPQGSGTPAAQPAPKAPGPGPDLVPPQTAPKPAPAGQTGASATPPAAGAAPAPDTELVKAQKGVGKQGRSLDEHEGMIVTPAKTFFTVRERIVFEVQIPSTLKTYKALHNDKGPATHEQFMKEIIEDGQIRLPQLNEDCSYVYDPKTEELMVRRAKR